jgi:uncharacterized membrane protein YccC
MHPLASRRIVRLAFGTSLALFISQAFSWSVSFIAPALVAFLLALPLPGLKLKQATVFVLALAIPVWGATWLLLPLLSHQQLVGLLLLVAACFWSFYYSASGGSPVLGAFLTMGLAIVTAVGSDSIDAALAVNYAVTVNAIIAMAMLWLAFFLFPDPPAKQALPQRPAAPKPERSAAIRSAWRSTVIVLPVILFFLVYQGSASYLVVMIKVASMGQQAENDLTRQVGKSLLLSTMIGGAGAVIMWNLLSIWPSLVFYCLLLAMGGLLMGRRIFKGAGMHPAAGTWSYAFLTMLVLIAPAVLDGPGGDAAGAKFFDRLSMMAWATLYAVAAVTVFDAFWRRKEPRRVVE